MPGQPVTIGASVVVTPGMTAAPDTGTILVVIGPPAATFVTDTWPP